MRARLVARCRLNGKSAWASTWVVAHAQSWGNHANNQAGTESDAGLQAHGEGPRVCPSIKAKYQGKDSAQAQVPCSMAAWGRSLLVPFRQ